MEVQKFKVQSYMPGNYIEEVIVCGRLLIKDGSYTFWTDVYGKPNRLIASYPIHYTIVKEIYDNENYPELSIL